MSEENIGDFKVDEKDILSDPYTDTDGMIDFLLTEDCAPKIVHGRAHIVDIVTKKEEPELLGGDVVQAPPKEPVINDANNVLAVNIRKNSLLTKFVGNPIENDHLVEVIRRDASTSTILNAVMEEMAEEAAFIKAWRNENWNAEADLSEATSKRIKMLKDLVEILIEREKLKKEKNVGKIDFYGENFQRVLKYFLETIQKTFNKVNIPRQFEDIFFSQLAKEFDGFEKIAEKTYYGKDK